ncbi:mediator of RNA polymerase II transcription subunit [Salvia divinorum]|uniref:Mediator of RNA polymerase II transcription subunit n=1 Tax=Salvia divinorum TaxID=28513 RepID=A0ABD1GNN4_SALDI
MLNSSPSSSASHSLDQARLRYKASVASLRSVLLAISNAHKVKSSESVLTSISGSVSDQTKLTKLQEQASILRTELAEKNNMGQILRKIQETVLW